MSLKEYTTIKIRRDTAANWALNNPIPLEGEWCLETNTGNVKIGDGSTAWNGLAYQHQSPYVQEITSSGSIVFKKIDNEIKVDLSLGNITINQLTVPDFIGQKVHIYGVGSGIGSIAGGTGLYVNGVYFTENTGGVFLTAVSLTEWRAENGVTADYVSGDYNLQFRPDGDYLINYIKSTEVTASIEEGNLYRVTDSLTFPISFASTSFKSLSASAAMGASSQIGWGGDLRLNGATVSSIEVDVLTALGSRKTRPTATIRGDY